MVSQAYKSRRKSALKEPKKFHLKCSDEHSNDQSNNVCIVSRIRGAHNIKEKFSNCMSNRQLRRWCAFEWFYSSIDYPWFAKTQFGEYLNHIGLCHVSRLTRVEWSVIKSSLGKVRRFSEKFLREERDNLNEYRDSVRTYYDELRSGKREGLPLDLAKPLSVGQRVVAVHPKTRDIHDGSVLAVGHTMCSVQFDRPELGVEFVMDIDCMPQNPMENMPACMENFDEQKLESLVMFSSGETSQNGGGRQSSYDAINLDPAKVQEKEAEVEALADFTRVLDKKEALISELRNMNDDIVENRSNGYNDLENSEPFKKHYTSIIAQLNEVNEQVIQVSSRPQPAVNLGDSGLPALSPCDEPVHDSHSNVKDIIESSREQARTLVKRTVHEMLLFNEEYNIQGESNSKIPSELISHCVATLFMIQKCTERKFASSDVTQILDSAVTSLKPRCSRNLPIYREIQKCMRIIQNRILREQS